MKKVLAALPALALLAGVVQARPAAPAPQSVPTMNVRWQGISTIPGGDADPDDNFFRASVAVDSEGTAHILQHTQAEIGPGMTGDVIRYMNTRLDMREAGGISNPVQKDIQPEPEHAADFWNLGTPDIWVDKADRVHAVWSASYTNADPMHGGYLFFSVIRYALIEADGGGSWVNLTDPIHNVFYREPQIVVDESNRVFVVAKRQDDRTLDQAGPDWKPHRIVCMRPGGSEAEIHDQDVPGGPRVALHLNRMCVVWSDTVGMNTDVFSKTGTFNPTTGNFEWATGPLSHTQVTTTGNNFHPDVDFDPDVNFSDPTAPEAQPHYVWSRIPAAGFAQIWHKRGAGSAQESEVSEGEGVEIAEDEYIRFDRGARVRVMNNEIHVFYAGFSHAYRSVNSTDPDAWARQQPLQVPRINQYFTDRPMEAAKSNGPRFDIIDARFYTRTVDSMPDGVSLVDAFPGASVNIVPLNGSLRYRLKLFSCQGVGPSTSMALNYDSKRLAFSHVGPGWIMDHMMHITVVDEENISLTMPNGLTLALIPDPQSGGFKLADPTFGFMATMKAVAGGFALQVPGGRQYAFSAIGRLGQITDPTGNRLEVRYDANNRCTEVVDMLGNGGSGRVTQLTYGSGASARYVTKIKDPEGNEYELLYTSGRLSDVIFHGSPEKPRFKFLYNTAGLLSDVLPPRGFASTPQYGYSVEYDPAGRVEKVEDPAELHVAENGTETSVRAKQEFFYWDTETRNVVGIAKYCTRVKDRRNGESVYVFDVANNYGVKEFWDPVNYANPDSHIEFVTRSFDSFGNVLEEKDRYGFVTSYTYVQSGGPGKPAAWLRNLVETVTKGGELVESFKYTADEFGHVEEHKRFATPTTGDTTVTSERKTTYTYCPVTGQLKTVSAPAVEAPEAQGAGVKQYFYDGPRKQLTRVVNEEGHATEYGAFHPLHGKAQIERRDGGEQLWQTRYDRMGNVTETLMPMGGPGNDSPGWTRMALDGLYRVAAVMDPVGNVTINTYDAESNLIKVQPPAGGPTFTDWDRRGYVKGGSSPDGNWTQSVDAAGNIRRTTNVRGHTTFKEYDILNRVTKLQAPGNSTVGAGGDQLMETEWSLDLRTPGENGERYQLETRKGFPSDRVTTTFFDARGRAVRVLAPDGGLTKTLTYYNELDEVVAVESYYNNILQNAAITFYNEKGRAYLTRIQDVAYGSTSANKSDTTVFHNRVGSLIQTRDPLGNLSTNILDARERVVYVVDGMAQIVLKNVWGDDDKLSAKWAPNPATKGTELSLVERYTYTAHKLVETVRDALGVGPTYTYTPTGQVATVTDALGRIMETTYYADTQRVHEVIVAKGTADERRTRSSWTRGLLTETQVGQAIFRSTYDEAGRLERFEAPLVAAENTTFNKFGELKRFSSGLAASNRKEIEYHYDSLGRNTSSVWTDAYDVTETRVYRAGNQPILAVDNEDLRRATVYEPWRGVPVDETFDIWDSQANEWQTFKIQSHGYDLAKNYTTFVDPEAGTHTWEYDPNNRVSAAKYKPVAPGLPRLVYSISYTPGGLVDQTTCFNEAGTQAIAVTTHYYDVRGRKIRMHTVNPTTSATLADFQFDYDLVGRVEEKRIAHLGVKFKYVYNNRDELTEETMTSYGGGATLPPDGTQFDALSVGEESAPSEEVPATPGGFMSLPTRTAIYEYDEAGNRTSMTLDGVTTTYAHNSANQLTGQSTPGRTVSHVYDQWGNESERTTVEGSTKVETYEYDYLNLLSAYANTGNPSADTQYQAYPTKERFERQPMAGSTYQRFVHRSWDVAADYDVDASGAATLKNVYVQGTGVDQKYLRIAAGSDGVLSYGDVRRHYVGDQVGTLGMTLNDSGGVENSTLSDAWGVQISGFSPLPERYGFAGRERDEESGLVHMRHRAYDPMLGRFTQTDPIVGNRPSEHYAYAANNPVSMVDPMGTDPWWKDKQFYEAERLEAKAQLKEARIANSVYLQRATNPWKQLLWKTSGDLFTDIGEAHARVLQAQGRYASAQKAYQDAMSGESGLAIRMAAELSMVNPVSRIGTGRAVTDPEQVELVDRALDAFMLVTSFGTAKLTSSLDDGLVRSGSRAGVSGRAPVPQQLPAGQAFEAQQLQALKLEKNTVVWRPTQADIDSAAFKVIVGPPKYTPGGQPLGTIFDSTGAGLVEIKGGTSALESSYQLRLQTYYSLKVDPQPYTIVTDRVPNQKFGDWLQRWGATIEKP